MVICLTRGLTNPSRTHGGLSLAPGGPMVPKESLNHSHIRRGRDIVFLGFLLLIYSRGRETFNIRVIY